MFLKDDYLDKKKHSEKGGRHHGMALSIYQRLMLTPFPECFFRRFFGLFVRLSSS